MKLFCIKQDDTGLYYLQGGWCEEPEWFSANEATRLMRELRDPSPLTLESNEFSVAECNL